MSPVYSSAFGILTPHFIRKTREGAGVKRKQLANVHLFRSPFRPELYRKHLETVHTQDWLNYKALSTKQKHKFFDEKQRLRIHAYLNTIKESITFDIPNVAIADELIGNFFFKPEVDEDNKESELIAKTNALNLFQPIFDCVEVDMEEEDGDANEEADRDV
ncbi:hypothetical protein AXG93_4877s1050 [Marchantia polymorpha subsp. ruderalis]|uniref:Uncharacterized protein n=1 Tax=Marchantia polymorpha subsp. ruderalis TaxID=1480154 RepID=A0A176WD09_MARPO|nr:hypothetical protein AXG93_4877s1050 [Marchantia polymorpha subsp. ruderalis]